MHFFLENHSKEENMKIQYANELIVNMELSGPTKTLSVHF